MIILNLKNYTESTTAHLWNLLDALDKVVNDRAEFKEKLFVAPSAVFLMLAKEKYPNLNFVAQHVDAKGPGSTTGWIPADVLLSNDINYTILNHSEHRVLPENYVSDLQIKGLKVIACCESVDEANIFLESGAFAIAYEPRDLIGSGISVTTRPEAVSEFVNAVSGKTLAIIGAGVSNREDVESGIKLGAQGALVASAFVKSSDPYTTALDLLSGL